MKKQLDQGFEVIIKGMEVVARVIGEDPPDDKKHDPKSEHPSTFKDSLREQEDNKGRSK